MKPLTYVTVVVTFTLLAFCAEAQSPEENKKVITRYLLEIFNGKKLDRLGEVFPEKFVRHDLNTGADIWMTVPDQQKRLNELF